MSLRKSPVNVRLFLACAVLSLLLVLPASPLAAQTHVLTPGGTHIYTEPSGLTILVRENHFAPVVTVRILVRTGAIYEDKYLGAGISHLAEHLVSGGTTPKRTEAESRKLVEELGGNTNAMTSASWTTYFIDTTADRLADAVDLLCDWTNNASITQEEFDREHQVVIEELKRGNDNVDREHARLTLENVYRVHPVRMPVIGYLPQLEAITRQDVLDYVHSRYVPNNMVVGVVGDVDPDTVVALVRKGFADYERKALPPVILPDEPPQAAFRPLIESRPGLNLTRLAIDFPTVKLDHDDMYPLDLLSYILSQGESSRLVRELRDRQKLVSSIDTSSYTPHFVDGVFSIDAGARPGMHDKVRDAVWTELERVMKTPVSDAELRQAKTQKIAEQVFSAQTVYAQCTDMNLHYVSTADPDYSKTYVDRIQHVTAADIQRVARKYFIRSHECFTVLQPADAPAEGNEKPAEKKTPDAQAVLFKLDNGLRLLVKRNPAVPAVSIQAYVLGGLRDENPKTSGLARLTAEMLTRGTRTRSAEQIAREFDFMGGAVNSASGNNTLYVSASVLSEHTPAALKLVADILRNPAFPPDELEGLRKRTLMALDGQKDRLSSVASRAFRQAMFPTSVYGLDQLGTPESVAGITRDDLLAFYRKCVPPDGMVLAVYGDVQPDQVLRDVQSIFSTWKAPAVTHTPPAVDKPASEFNLVIHPVDKRHETAVIHIGFQGTPNRNTADVDALTVLQAVMGGYGYPGGWLHNELRGKREGLVYATYAYSVSWLDTGFMDAYAQCASGNIVEVTRIMLEAFAKARRGEITPEEIQLAKIRIITTRLLSSQTAGDQASEAAINELYGFGFTFGDSLAQRINAVTLDDLKRVALKYFTAPVVVVTAPNPDVAESIRTLLLEK